MGHYRSEMWCNSCGQTFCVCKKRQDPPEDHLWVIHELKVMTVGAWKEAFPNFGLEASMFNMYLLTLKRFKTKEEAEQLLSEMLVRQIMEAEALILRLVKAHDVLPCNKATPWRLNSEGI